MSRPCIVNASDVAIITRDNTYRRKLADYRNDLWKRTSADTYTGQTQEEILRNLFLRSPPLQRILRVALSTLSSNSNVVAVIESAETELQNERQHLILGNTDFRCVHDHLVSTIRKTYGTMSEGPTAAAFIAASASAATVELQAISAAVVANTAAVVTTAAAEAAVATTIAGVALATTCVTAAKTSAQVAEDELGVLTTSGQLSASDATVVAATARVVAATANISHAEAVLAVAAVAALEAENYARVIRVATTEALAAAACRVDETRTIAKRARVSAIVKDPKTYELLIGKFNGFECVIRGKIDRIEETCDGRRLIEIKKRTSRLFHCVPSYENIQIQVYLQMLNLQRAQLWEMFGEDVEKHDVARDDELYSTHIMPQVRSFCEELCASMSVQRRDKE